MHTEELVKKSRLGDVLSKKELVYLLSLAPDSAKTYMVMAEATRLSKELSGGKAEVHAQFAINLAPCPCDCLFCS
ncbi:MAG: radical SAM protein, partial [Desulfobacterales bacterium]